MNAAAIPPAKTVASSAGLEFLRRLEQLEAEGQADVLKELGLARGFGHQHPFWAGAICGAVAAIVVLVALFHRL